MSVFIFYVFFLLLFRVTSTWMARKKNIAYNRDLHSRYDYVRERVNAQNSQKMCMIT